MKADIEQDIDGKLWLLLADQNGNLIRISHEMATAPPAPPSFRVDAGSVKWSAPRYAGFVPVIMEPRWPFVGGGLA